MNFNSEEAQQIINKKSPVYGCANMYPNDWDTHRHNVYGFRETREYQTGKTMALGCSYTYGVGIEKEETWPYLLENMIGDEVYNFGVGGGGPTTITRLVSYWAPKIKPKNVLVSLKYIGLFEVYWRGRWLKVTPSVDGYYEGNDITAQEADVFAEENIYADYHRNMKLLKHICRDNGCKLILLDKEIPKSDKLATDKLHAGPNWNKQVAELFKERM